MSCSFIWHIFFCLIPPHFLCSFLCISRSDTFPNLGEVGLFRRCPIGLKCTVIPGHQSQTFKGCLLCGLCIFSCGRATAAVEPWWVGLLLHSLWDPAGAQGWVGLLSDHTHWCWQVRWRIPKCNLLILAFARSPELTKMASASFSLWGTPQLIPASLADLLRLVSGFPSPEVHELFNLVFFPLVFRLSEPAHESSKNRFYIHFCSVVFSDHVPISFQSHGFGSPLNEKS